MARFLFSLPVHHGVNYASCIAEGVAYGQPTTNGTVAANVDAIYFQDPDVFWSVGHGSPGLHTVDDAEQECTEDFIRTGASPLGLGLFGGRVVHLLSCKCGQELVPDLVSKGGAEAAIGYEDYFYYGVKIEGDPDPAPCSPPTNRADYYTFNDCDLEVQRALLDGKSVKEAVAASQAEHEKQIERYETGDRSDWPIAEEAAIWLNVNMTSQVLYESGAPPPIYAGLGTLGTMFMLSGMFLVGAMVYGKATTGKWALPWG